jgi:hypothetical protein
MVRTKRRWMAVRREPGIAGWPFDHQGHYFPVSRHKSRKWLGHSSYVLTLTTYADYIPDVEAENPLPEPVAPTAPATNVFALRPATG